MTTPKPDHDTGEPALLGRRAVIRGGLAGGLALAGLFLNVGLHEVEARSKSVKRRKPTTTAKAKANVADTSSGSNGANQGGSTVGEGTTGKDDNGTSGTGNNGTGTNAGNGAPGTGNSNTGDPAGGDTTGTSQTKPPVTGETKTGTNVTCTTQGAVVDAQNPSNNSPGGKVCTQTP